MYTESRRRGMPPEMWGQGQNTTPSMRAGTAALLGVYGPEFRFDADLIAQAFSPEGLPSEKIAELEAMREAGVEWRFGPTGLF